MTETWKLEKDLCRCCHSEGSYKSLALPWMTFGVEEVYADMLMECYNIAVAPVNGPLHDITFAICEPCIQRLRDATFFKKQVLDCEQKFKRMYANNVLEAHNKVEVKKEPVIFLDDMEDDDDEQIDYDDDFANDKVFQRIKNEVEDIDESEVKIRKKIKGKGKAKPKKKITKKKKGTESSPKTNLLEDRLKSESIYEGRYTLIKEDGELFYSCNECGRRFNKRDLFTQHYRHVHMKMRPKTRSCYLCTERVPGHKRTFHLETVHGRKPPTCNACGKKFAFPWLVLKHQRNFHMGERQFKCSFCDMMFTQLSLVKKHEAKHSEVRKFKCHLCEKGFKWKKNLKTHIMMHLDVRNYVCEICDEAFVQQSSLKYHMSKRHPEYV